MAAYIKGLSGHISRPSIYKIFGFYELQEATEVQIFINCCSKMALNYGSAKNVQKNVC